ncbi:MAG: hypothetical protein ACJ71N_11745 [Terriglobales bacterium]
MKRRIRQTGLVVVAGFCSVLAAAQGNTPARNVGLPMDWSYAHVLHSDAISDQNLALAEGEPRMMYNLLQRNQRTVSPVALSGAAHVPANHGPKRRAQVDWSFSLGTGIVAPNMSPAKFTFDVNATPSCTNDFVVFGLNVAGTTSGTLGQPNLLALNNLYSGPGPTGICPTALAPQANPSVMWAYNTTTSAGGAVLTSPSLSLDGTKVAFVESTATSAIFHVLTWKTGEGGPAITNTVAPTTVGSCTVGSSCLTSVTFSNSASDTISSPWIDYASDKAYVGDDNGVLRRISCVFNCALNANPTIDWSFTLPVAGTGSAVTLTAPVFDSSTNRVFIGDSLGELWAIKSDGSAVAAGPIMIGGAGCTVTNPPNRVGTPVPCATTDAKFGVVDGVILDSGNSKVFAFAGNDGVTGSSATVVQASTSLASTVRVGVGQGSKGIGSAGVPVDIHMAAFDNNYFGATPSTGFLYVCGTNTANTKPALWRIGFNTAYPAMNSSASAGPLQLLNANGVQCAPMTEFFNPNVDVNSGVAGAQHDLLFTGLQTATGSVLSFDISGAFPGASLASVSESGGTSGIVVDNVSTSAQASSVYFSTQGTTKNAVKLTQVGLQ